MKNRLVFLCGALRSGTSMTHLMLNSHPQISNPGEFDFFFDLLSQKGTEPGVEEFFDYLSTDRIFLSKNLRLDNNADNYASVLQNFVEQLGKTKDKLCLNLHRNFDCAYTYFPDAKYIHLVRDPRDVARSSIGMGWAGNVYYGVKHWVDTEESWQRLLPKLDKHQYTEIQFENLVREPELNLANLCHLIDLSYEPCMLDYENNSSYSKPDVSLINQWKKKLSERETELVELRAGRLMRINSYPTTVNAPKEPSIIERLSLKIENTVHRERFSIGRYGLGLHLALRMTEKLGLKWLRKTTASKSRAIIKKHLK